MKNILKIMLIACAYCIASCNQKSPEEEAREQQQHDDSLKAAIVAEISAQTQSQSNTSSMGNIVAKNENSTSKQQMANLVAEGNSITDAKLQLNKLNILLANAKAKLEYENNELTRLEQFHIGRTKAERETAVRNQDLRVQAYQNYVQKVQDAIIQLHEKINAMQDDINNAAN